MTQAPSTQYSYTVLEAAALWAGFDPEIVISQICKHDQDKAEAAYRQAVAAANAQDFDDEITWQVEREACAQCERQTKCPDWSEVETADGDIRSRLQCPHGFTAPPAESRPSPRVIAKPSIAPRTLPFSGEFSDLPEFEKRITWLLAAIGSSDLAGTAEFIRASDLRDWITRNFPGDRPAFLFPDTAALIDRINCLTTENNELRAELARAKNTIDSSQEVTGKSKTSYLNIIGSLLALLCTKHGYKGKTEALCEEIWELFDGEGASPSGVRSSNLDKVFGEAKRQIIAHNHDVGSSAFPNSTRNR